MDLSGPVPKYPSKTEREEEIGNKLTNRSCGGLCDGNLLRCSHSGIWCFISKMCRSSAWLQELREAGPNVLQSSLCPGLTVNGVVCGFSTLAVEKTRCWWSFSLLGPTVKQKHGCNQSGPLEQKPTNQHQILILTTESDWCYTHITDIS